MLRPLLASLCLSAGLINGIPLHAETTGAYSRPSSPGIHALILAIGNYPAPITPLAGVAHDIESAKSIARRMGVPEQNLHVLHDQELTLAGMKQAFADLQQRVRPNDQVFIYYSGHGGRSLAIDETPPDRCAESLITYDGYGFRDTLMESYLKALATKAQKIIVFIDACHAGGVTTRSLPANHNGLTPKFWDDPAAQAAACARPSNVLTRSWGAAAQTRGLGGGNFIYIAAARADELSFDEAGKGGIATQSWLNCLNGSAQDLDGSGGLTAEEIRICAQQQVDRKLAANQGILPSHVVLTGNQGMVLSYATTEASTPPAPPTTIATTTVSAQRPTPAPAPAPVAQPTPPATPLPAHNALNDIFNNRDDRRLVTLSLEKRRLRIGADSAKLSIHSRESGYLYLLLAGSDGKSFNLLYPNQIDTNNRIYADETLQLPARNWQLSAQGPAGKSTILAVVSDTPRDFARSGFLPAGIFASATGSAARAMQLLTVDSAACEKSPSGTSTANCRGSYGAALAEFEEIAPDTLP